MACRAPCLAWPPHLQGTITWQQSVWSAFGRRVTLWAAGYLVVAKRDGWRRYQAAGHDRCLSWLAKLALRGLAVQLSGGVIGISIAMLRQNRSGKTRIPLWPRLWRHPPGAVPATDRRSGRYTRLAPLSSPLVFSSFHQQLHDRPEVSGVKFRQGVESILRSRAPLMAIL